MTFKIKKENYKLISKVLTELGFNHNEFREEYIYYLTVNDDKLVGWIDKVYDIYVIRLENGHQKFSLPLKLFEAIW